MKDQFFVFSLLYVIIKLLADNKINRPGNTLEIRFISISFYFVCNFKKCVIDRFSTNFV